MNTELRKELLKLDRDYRDALRDNNSGAVERLTADPSMVVGAQGAGLLDRKSLTGMMSSGDYRLKSYKMDEAKASVRELAAGVALVAYPVHEDYERGGQRFSSDAYNVSTWMKQGGKWQCAVHSESLAGAPKPVR